MPTTTRASAPATPPELFALLAGAANARRLAWDCGTGNGQTAIGVAKHFEAVVATDASRRQIDAARAHPRVRYAVATAEASGLEPATVDLVTVSQALHWFDHPRFFAEVARVCAPGGLVAASCYRLFEVSDAVDAIVRDFYDDTTGPYWSPVRRFVDEGYASIEAPFERVELEPPPMSVRWELEQMLGFVGTWSAVKTYQRERGEDPLVALRNALAPAWGSGEREVRWPLALRTWRV